MIEWMYADSGERQEALERTSFIALSRPISFAEIALAVLDDIKRRVSTHSATPVLSRRLQGLGWATEALEWCGELSSRLSRCLEGKESFADLFCTSAAHLNFYRQVLSSVSQRRSFAEPVPGFVAFRWPFATSRTVLTFAICRIHLLTFTLVPMLASLIFWGSNGRDKISFVNSMFMCYSCVHSPGA